MPKIGNTNNNYNTLINRFLNCLKQLKSQIWIQIELIFFSFSIFSFLFKCMILWKFVCLHRFAVAIFSLSLSLFHSCSLLRLVCRFWFVVCSIFLLCICSIEAKNNFFFYSKNMYQTKQKQNEIRFLCLLVKIDNIDAISLEFKLILVYVCFFFWLWFLFVVAREKTIWDFPLGDEQKIL